MNYSVRVKANNRSVMPGFFFFWRWIRVGDPDGNKIGNKEIKVKEEKTWE